MGILKQLGLEKRSLRYKLSIAFALMSIIPLLIMAYFIANYIFPETKEEMFQIGLIIVFAIWIAGLGYILARELVLPVISLAAGTKLIAEGRYDTEITLDREDEIGDVAKAVNVVTNKMRSYLGELKKYSKETTTLNLRIHKKVLTLTNLMKLGDLISSGTEFKEIASFAAERIASELYDGFCAIFTRDKLGSYLTEAEVNNSSTSIAMDNVRFELISLEKLLHKSEYILVDTRNLQDIWQKTLREKMNNINVIIFPIKIKIDIVGVVVLGNFSENMEFSDDDIEVLRAFAKELVLGYQSSKVLERVKSLEIVDSLTGLYTFNYIENRLDDEIVRAIYYQRPCSFLMIGVDDFKEEADVLKKISDLISKNVPPIAKAGRSDDGIFAVILPERNKREAIEMAENIRKAIEGMKISTQANDRITVSIGVGENPIDGSTAKEITSRSRQYMEKAKASGKNKVLGE